MTQANNSVRMNNGFKLFLSLMAVLVVIFVAFAALSPQEIPEGYVDQEAVQSSVDIAVAEALEGLSEKDSLIADLQSQLEESSSDDVELVISGYLIDELLLSVPLEEDLFSDRELNLFDGKVNFDGDEYDAEETLILKDIELLANERDFEGQVYMSVPEGAIEYRLNFDSELDTSLINEDDTLVFNFLGKELEVSEWDGDSIVFFQGESFILEEGESVTVDGKLVTLEFASSDSVYVSVDGESRALNEGDIRTINDLQVKLEYSFETSSFRLGQAKLIIAEDIEESVQSGDEYEEDSPWEWVIDSSSIGLILVEGFEEVDADGDEEFQAIAAGESISLPNDYVSIRFNGMSVEDEEEYSFRLDEREGFDFVRVDGNFLSGLEDYSRIYINSSGIFDRDLELIDVSEVELGDSDVVLSNDAGWIIVEDFRVNHALNVSEANGDVLNDDEDYLSEFGIRIVNPEDSAEDNEYSIAVPQEQLEGSISLI